MNAKRFRKLLDRLDRRPSALFRRILLQTLMRRMGRAVGLSTRRASKVSEPSTWSLKS